MTATLFDFSEEAWTNGCLRLTRICLLQGHMPSVIGYEAAEHDVIVNFDDQTEPLHVSETVFIADDAVDLEKAVSAHIRRFFGEACDKV